MENPQTLILGQGLNSVKFGQDLEEIKKIFGQPDNQEEFTQEDQEELTIDYDSLEITFAFKKDYNSEKFLLMDIISENPNISLEKKIFIDDTKEKVEKELQKLKVNPPICGHDNDSGEDFFFNEDINLNLIYQKDTLVAIQIGVFTDENGEIIFPE